MSSPSPCQWVAGVGHQVHNFYPCNNVCLVPNELWRLRLAEEKRFFFFFLGLFTEDGHVTEMERKKKSCKDTLSVDMG